MKALYVFLFCSSLLSLVACSDEVRNEQEEIIPVAASVVKTQSAFDNIAWPVTIDSFKSSIVNRCPGSMVMRKTPKNKFALHKDKDSITFSGSLYFAYDNKEHKPTYRSYHFYLKAGLSFLDAYLKNDLIVNEQANDKRLQNVLSTESGYHMDWSQKVQG